MAIKIGVTGVKKLDSTIPSIISNITIDSNVSSPIANGFHGISTQEVWKLGSNVSNFRWFDDLLEPTFVDLVKELNPSSLQHPGLANADLEIVDIGNTSLDQAVGTGGLNCDATSGCSVQDGLCCPDTDYGHPAFSNLLELSKLCSTTRPIAVSHVMNVQIDAMTDLTAWADQAVWKLDFCSDESIPVYNIQLGLEQNTGGNDIWWDAVGQTLNPALPAIQTNVANYLIKTQAGTLDLRTANPTAKIFLDTSPIFETTNRDLGWRKGIVNTGGLDYDGVREYMLHHNFSTEWTLGSDFISNLEEVLNVIEVVIPERLDDIDTYYSQKLINIVYGLPDQSSTTIHDTLLGLMFIVWEVQACLDWNHSNGSKVFGMSYQSMNGLIRQNSITRKLHFYGPKVIGKFLETDDMEYVPVQITDLVDVKALCVRDNNTYYILAVNYSSVQVTSPDVKIDSTLYTNSIRYTVQGTSLSATTITESTESLTSFIMPPYSINVFKFSI